MYVDLCLNGLFLNLSKNSAFSLGRKYILTKKGILFLGAGIDLPFNNPGPSGPGIPATGKDNRRGAIGELNHIFKNNLIVIFVIVNICKFFNVSGPR